VRETKTLELLCPFPDELLADQLPEPVPLTPEQLALVAAAEERHTQRQVEWDEIIDELEHNSTAVFRAMRQCRRESEQDQVERVAASYRSGAFLLDRLGAGVVGDQDLAVVLLDLRHGLTRQYGGGPATMMLIDRAIAAYQNIVRVNGWVGNLAIRIEHEFFGRHGPSMDHRDRHGREDRKARGLTVEQHLIHLRETLLPLAERCGRAMRESLTALETLRAAPSEAIERSKPLHVSVLFEPAAEYELASSAYLGVLRSLGVS